jgi:hypothetical protein
MADLFGETTRDEMMRTIEQHHYTHSVPAGKSHYFNCAGTIVVFSIPANPYIGEWLLGSAAPVWELSRLWAPDGHAPNALTRAISMAIKQFQKFDTPEAIISYADPNVGHHGGVYRAASFVYLGDVEETRYYRSPTGVVARRSFHSGSRHLIKSEIEALGYTEERMAGKHRYARGLTPRARKAIAGKASRAIPG